MGCLCAANRPGRRRDRAARGLPQAPTTAGKGTPTTPTPLRAAVVGTGHRARLFARGLAARPGHRVVALRDPNPTRMAFHTRPLTEAGEPAATTWSPERRLESEVEKNRWRPPGPDAVPGDTRLTLRPLWRPPVDVPLDLAREAHGGG
ncbi:hypothetical protein ACIPEL_00330 [Streptomyces griseoviridis]